MNATYQSLGRGQYSYTTASANQVAVKSKVPIEVVEARNSVQIAKAAGADHFATNAFNKAQASLTQAETILAHKGDRKLIVQASRDAVQNASECTANRDQGAAGCGDAGSGAGGIHRGGRAPAAGGGRSATSGGRSPTG